MFNKTFVMADRTPSYSSNTTTTINENRAPTDSSIKLYHEMVDKARKELLDTIVVDNNTINLKAALFRDHLERNVVCNYEVLLNGSKLVGSIRVSDYQRTESYLKDIIIRIVKKVSEQLAQDIVELAMTTGEDIIKDQRYTCLNNNNISVTEE